MESYQNAGWVACIDQVGSCLVPNMFEKLTPKTSPPHTGSAEITLLKKFNPWVSQPLYNAIILAKISLSLMCFYQTVSPQVNQGTWTDLRHWERGKRRGRRDAEGTCWNQIVPTWQFSPCHRWPFATNFHTSFALLPHPYTLPSMWKTPSNRKQMYHMKLERSCIGR